MNQQRRLTKIGNIRALAIFMVVLGHSIILYYSNWDLYSLNKTKLKVLIGE